MPEVCAQCFNCTTWFWFWQFQKPRTNQCQLDLTQCVLHKLALTLAFIRLLQFSLLVALTPLARASLSWFSYLWLQRVAKDCPVCAFGNSAFLLQLCLSSLRQGELQRKLEYATIILRPSVRNDVAFPAILLQCRSSGSLDVGLAQPGHFVAPWQTTAKLSYNVTLLLDPLVALCQLACRLGCCCQIRHTTLFSDKAHNIIACQAD